MSGPFRPSAPLLGGYLWKRPWRLSAPQKFRQRKRLRHVDHVVSTLDLALKRWKADTLSRIPHSSPASLSSSAAASGVPTLQHARLASTSTKSITTGPGPAAVLSSQKAAATASSHKAMRELQAAARRPGNLEEQAVMLSSSAGPADSGTGAMERLEAQEEGRVKMDEIESIRVIARWKAEMPTEAEMLPRDKYTIFDRKERKYRKGIHKLPKWTRVSQRLNPPGF